MVPRSSPPSIHPVGCVGAVDVAVVACLSGGGVSKRPSGAINSPFFIPSTPPLKT